MQILSQVLLYWSFVWYTYPRFMNHSTLKTINLKTLIPTSDASHSFRPLGRACLTMCNASEFFFPMTMQCKLLIKLVNISDFKQHISHINTTWCQTKLKLHVSGAQQRIQEIWEVFRRQRGWSKSPQLESSHLPPGLQRDVKKLTFWQSTHGTSALLLDTKFETCFPLVDNVKYSDVSRFTLTISRRHARWPPWSAHCFLWKMQSIAKNVQLMFVLIDAKDN